jgi:hypothetical protein
MVKSRKNKTNILKNIRTTADKTLPVVGKGLTNVGVVAKDTARYSVPVIEKGVSEVYGTMATGLDLGVKGAKSIARGVTKSKKRRSRKGSRSRRKGRK